MKKILWATTFREFRGNKNDIIQFNFLNSLSLIEDVEIDLYVTTFGETNVINNIKEIHSNSFLQDSQAELGGGYRYSQSLVLNNALKFYLENYENYSGIVWSTCDIVVPKKIFSFLEMVKDEEFLGTSHPNNILNDFGIYKSYKIESGGDFFCFANLSKSNVIKLIELNVQFPNNDYGIYEHFLIASAKILKIELFNFYKFIRILKFENNRELTDETNNWIINGWKNNQKIMIKMLSEYSLSKYYAYNMTFCMSKFNYYKLNNSLHKKFKFLSSSFYLLVRSIYKKYFKKENINFFEIF